MHYTTMFGCWSRQLNLYCTILKAISLLRSQRVKQKTDFKCHQGLLRYDSTVHLALDMPPPYMVFSTPASLYLDFPQLTGTYLCLYMCIICRFMVMKNKTKKYINRMGQNTGISKTEKKVMNMQVAVPLVHANQNLNSGSRLANGRNSFPSSSVVGRPGPLSEGSSRGDKKAMKLFNKKIPNP
mmetsp:Transcript_29662/g.49175  ORF Transcript_29662/g.49175 Transcript_29662/m.49175 type:complete len:183 (+) Transcript_29662:33-581(+)